MARSAGCPRIAIGTCNVLPGRLVSPHPATVTAPRKASLLTATADQAADAPLPARRQCRDTTCSSAWYPHTFYRRPKSRLQPIAPHVNAPAFFS